MSTLRIISRYRSYIFSSVSNDFKSKYIGSFMGGLWSIIHPIIMITIYTLIFSHVMKIKIGLPDQEPIDYSIYLCTGIIFWNLFSELSTTTINIFYHYSSIYKKIPIPIPVFLVINTINSIISFLPIFIIFTAYLLLLNKFPASGFIFIIPLLIFQIFFTISFASILAVLNVFNRDIYHFYSVFLSLLFWLTPIVYSINIIPSKYHYLLALNPIYSFIENYHKIIVFNDSIDFHKIIFIFFISLILITIFIFLFKRLKTEILDNV